MEAAGARRTRDWHADLLYIYDEGAFIYPTHDYIWRFMNLLWLAAGRCYNRLLNPPFIRMCKFALKIFTTRG